MSQLKAAPEWGKLVAACQEEVLVEGRRLSVSDICRRAFISPKTYLKLKGASVRN